MLLNGAVLGTVLVRPRRYYGTVHEIAIERGRDAPLCYLTSGDNILRFEVPKDVPHQNGIAILGEAVEELKDGEMPILLDLRLGRVDQIEDYRHGVGAAAAED